MKIRIQIRINKNKTKRYIYNKKHYENNVDSSITIKTTIIISFIITISTITIITLISSQILNTRIPHIIFLSVMSNSDGHTKPKSRTERTHVCKKFIFLFFSEGLLQKGGGKGGVRRSQAVGKIEKIYISMRGEKISGTYPRPFPP